MELRVQGINTVMALFPKVVNLFSAANKVADKISMVAKGVLCIPSILSNLPSILGAVAANTIGVLRSQLSNLIEGLSSTIDKIIDETISNITGRVSAALNKILQLQATIIGTLNLIKDLISGLQTRASDVLKFIKNEENCKFAAAELMSCITAEIVNDMSKKVANKLNSGALKATEFSRNTVLKISKPGNLLENYVSKIGASVDKATAQLDLISRI